MVTADRRLDELVLEALAAQLANPQPLPRAPEVSIEIVDEEDAAATTRFVRVSAPYLAVQVEPVATLPRVRRRTTTFAKTVPARAPQTLQFDKVWFDEAKDVVPSLDDLPAEPRRWLWLAVILGAAMIATAAIALLAL